MPASPAEFAVPPASKTALCPTCHAPFVYQPVYFDGREFLPPVACPPCAELDDARKRDEVATRERAERVMVWSKLGLPFQTKETATILADLPCQERSLNCLRWQPGAKSLFLNGKSGGGKTRTMIELLRRLWVESGREFVFLSWPSWHTDLDSSSRYGSKEMDRKVTRLFTVPILAMDDVGKGRCTDALVTAFFRVIDNRCGAGRTTFVTTNYALTSQPGSPFERKLAEGSADTSAAICRRVAEHFSNQPFVLP